MVESTTCKRKDRAPRLQRTGEEGAGTGAGTGAGAGPGPTWWS